MNNDILRDKRVLMFCVDFFGYREQIMQGMIDMGAHVDLYDERPDNQVLTKIMVRKDIRLVYPKLYRYYAGIIEKNRQKQYDYVLVVKGEGVNCTVIKMLRDAYPKAKFILYLWDAVENIPDCQARMQLYDKVLTFDPNDAVQYKLPFRAMFYGKDFLPMEQQTEYKYDICFVGTAHSIRPRIVKQVEAICQKQGLRFFYYLYSPHILVYWLNKLTNSAYRYVKKSDIQFTPMSRQDMLQVYQDSKCVLDIEHPKQHGTTSRPLEMLQLGKKILTANKEIKQFDFYRPENFLILDAENPQFTAEFLEQPYVQVSDDVLHKYSLEGFLSEVFSI